MPVDIISSEYLVRPAPFPPGDCADDRSVGVAVAIAIKAAIQKHDIAGKIVLLGTPGARNPQRHFNSYLSCGCSGRGWSRKSQTSRTRRI